MKEINGDVKNSEGRALLGRGWSKKASVSKWYMK